MLGMIRGGNIGKMAVEQLNRFNLGFISPYDVDTEKVPSNAFADCLNIEVNDPLVGIRATEMGEYYYLGIGANTGSKTIAYKKFMINYPERKEISLLIKQSENLLRFSEDFEVPYDSYTGFSGWIHDTGLTVTPNIINAPFTSRRADRINGSNGLKLSQRFSEMTFVTGRTYNFSVFMNAPSYDDHPIKIRISDGDGHTETSCIPFNGIWTRFNVTRTLSNNGAGWATVEIEFTSTRSVYLWGAQVTESSELREYGYTTVYTKPYYFFMRPYTLSASGGWIDSWLELNEMRAGLIQGWGGGEQFSVSSDIDGTNDYYQNWAIVNAHNFSEGSIITKYESSTHTFYVGPIKFLSNGKPVVLCRSAAMFSKFYINSDWAVEDASYTENNDLWFTQIGDDIRINLSENYAPFYIGLRKSSQFGFNGANRKPNFNGFFLSLRDLRNHLAAPNQSRKLATLEYSDVVYQSGGSLKPDTTYRLWMVGIFDGSQEVLLGYDDIYVSSTQNALTPYLDIYPALLTPRLTSIKIYIHEGNNTDFDTTYYLYTSTNSNWTIADETSSQDCYRLVFPTVNDIDTTQDVLSGEFTYNPLLDISPRYKTELYLNGRSYITSRAYQQIVRFSSIRTIVSEPDIFPFSYSDGYGFFAISDAGGEYITALCPLGRDLLVLSNKRVYTYMITSMPHQLLTVFNGIGCYSSKVVAYNTDYGTFWCDENDIYWYIGGTEPPKRISLQKISQYWRKVLSKYLSTAFTIYYKRLNEYWIFIQVSGNLGSSAAEDYKVFRYSIANDNFNILQFNEVPFNFTFTEDGYLILLSYDSYGTLVSMEWGRDTSFCFPNAYFMTHKLTFGTAYTEKMLKEVGVEYNITHGFDIKLYINDESNERVAISFFNEDVSGERRGVRQGLTFRKIAVKCEKSSFELLFRIKEINLNYFQRIWRIGRA